jgi:hypothetical protein
MLENGTVNMAVTLWKELEPRGPRRVSADQMARTSPYSATAPLGLRPPTQGDAGLPANGLG